ncbi:transposase [Synechococcus sp. PCC 7502]|uniref:transposase n=1 Tax=Synechococcus sp. PCC 7502 TaxID=1173263 RepID=UPI00031444ED|nr:transposase [Synechococcus sp. PCC 7502]
MNSGGKGILYQLKNGCNWRDMSRDLPPFSTVYRYYKEWKDNHGCSSFNGT